MRECSFGTSQTESYPGSALGSGPPLALPVQVSGPGVCPRIPCEAEPSKAQDIRVNFSSAALAPLNARSTGPLFFPASPQALGESVFPTLEAPALHSKPAAAHCVSQGQHLPPPGCSLVKSSLPLPCLRTLGPPWLIPGSSPSPEP